MKTDKTKRLGLILASLHQGASVKLWTQLAQNAAQDANPFFIFAGGRLGKKSESDHLRNSIYNLVNTENLDALISWASAIGSGGSFDELRQFHAHLEPLPFVTIGQKISGTTENHPCADFDAYEGMRSLLRHFIDVHHAKKIAFLHGPASHKSAQERYTAYVETVRSEGYSSDEISNLTSSSFSWNEGEKAIKELVEVRGLVPGRDFDALVASSDMMALEAEKYLEKKGWKIPEDIILGGFNNSEECNVADPPLTTVHMPHSELGMDAYKMARALMNGGEVGEDTMRATSLIVRESCGCNQVHSWLKKNAQSADIVENEEKFLAKIAEILRLSAKEKETQLAPAFHDAANGNQDKALQKYGALVFKFLKSGGEISDLFAISELIDRAVFIPQPIRLTMLSGIDKMVIQMQLRVSAQHRYDSYRLHAALNSLKCDLLTVHDRESLVKLLAENLPKIGIERGAIVLYEDNTFSRYIGGFSEDGADFGDNEIFPSSLLVPSTHTADYATGVYIVQPLFIENQPLGYFIASFTDADGTVYEDLRAAISSSLKSILQFEETTAAKSEAERAEFAKTEFFANVGSDLIDPLKEISAKIDSIEKNVESGTVEKDIISDQVLFLKSQVLTQLEKMETLVDLTRSQINDLPMDKRLFDIRDAIPEIQTVEIAQNELPLVFGDCEKLSKALEILAQEGNGTIRITPKPNGMHLVVNTGRVNWHLPALQLAEKIIALQFGEIKKAEHEATVIFPYPNIAGLPPQKTTILPSRLLFIGKTEETFGLELPKMPFEEKSGEETDENFLLLWNAENSLVDDVLKVYAMRKSNTLCRIPILCSSKIFEGKTFLEVLEQKVRKEKRSPVLFVNCRHTRYSPWATDKNSMSIPSMDNFEKILDEITPSLIIFESVDEAAIKQIRKNRKTVLVPILVIPDTIVSEKDVAFLCENPRIILCNRGAAESVQFSERVQSILSGDEILPPHTGALVKNAILYLNKYASEQIVRWKLADEVHVSEDYLTRIFHKEIGLSLWEYLNRYRIYIATQLLLETNDTIYEIAEKSGFQDQAYFCRVFKKIYGVPPGKIRTNTRPQK